MLVDENAFDTKILVGQLKHLNQILLGSNCEGVEGREYAKFKSYAIGELLFSIPIILELNYPRVFAYVCQISSIQQRACEVIFNLAIMVTSIVQHADRIFTRVLRVIIVPTYLVAHRWQTII